MLKEKFINHMKLCHEIIFQAPMSIVITDSDGIIQFVNQKTLDLTGYTDDEMIGKPTSIFQSGMTSHRAYESLWKTIRAGLVWKGQFINKKKNGELYIEDAIISPIKDDSGKIVNYFAIKEDVGMKLELQRRLEISETHDKLTSLINRSEFETHLKQAITTSKERDVSHILAIIDIDNFKLVNDAVGVDAGDELVRQFVLLFSQCFRTRDIPCRLGGDEFGILFEKTSADDAYNTCERFRKTVNEWGFMWKGKPIRISVSIGLTKIDHMSLSPSSVLSNCGLAMNRAKELGKNRIEVFSDSERFRECVERMEMCIKVKSSMKDNNLALFCQKIQSVSESNQDHYEILVRLIDGDRVIMPGAFLEISEQFHIIFELDMWIIEKTLAFIHTHMMDSDQIFTINLSGKTIGDSRALSVILSFFEKYGIPYNRIGFEITETAAILDFEEARRAILRLRSLGCRILIDDFGCGSSSLGRLQTLEADVIKIDGSFIKDICTNTFDQIVVKSVIQLAKALNMKTVAEFVHSEDVYNEVKALGIDFGQGYYIEKPVPICSLICSAKRCQVDDTGVVFSECVNQKSLSKWAMQ